MLSEVNIALSQISPKIGDKKRNLNHMKKQIKQAKENGANLIVFPELALTGYTLRDTVYESAEPIPGPSTNLLTEVAKKENIHMIFGMVEKSQKANAVLYNTAVLLSPKGLVGKYQKMHLPTHSVFEEKRYFRLGYELPVFETNVGKLGIIICYDVFFPETVRLLRLKGAQLIICISASPAVRSKFFEALIVARAIENTVFLAYVNLVGIEDGLQFWGGSRLIAPNGSVISQAKYDDEDLVIGKINYGDLKRIETFVPTLRDLRPELFGFLKKQAENL
ncbi:MAG: carbon-nitrogen hydrolase family protein [Candidatus Bathyarchaeota archaeon]|nr:carbon-nitrogen hydrolase family protein [Candidatus Bathyarchaeota archaeon]MDH5732681.1 carbon-nitrogen hydrolase family protein [Candidatus Bathyarchaeota archaeon]